MKKFFETKDFLKHNLGIKIASFICAIILFAITPENQDVYRNDIFTGIPLSVVGEETLYNKGLVLTEALPSDIKITLNGRVSALRAIEERKLGATLDLSKIEREGTFDLPLEIDGLALTTVEFVEKPVISVQVDTMVTTFIQLLLDLPEEDETMIAKSRIDIEPQEVKVRGSKTVLDQIAKAIVFLDVEQLDDTEKQTVPINFFDVDGKPLNDEFLYVDDYYADISIYPYKVLDIKPNLQGTVAEGYVITDVILTPSKVTVSADKQILDKLQYIQTQLVDVSGRTEDLIQEIGINMPIDVALGKGETETISVYAKIQPIVQKTITINKVTFENLKEEFTAKLVNQQIMLEISGPKTEVDNFDEEKIVAAINMEDAKKGTKKYEIAISIDNQWINIDSKPKEVEVKIDKK